MIDWPVKITICGLDELPGHCAAGVTHALSILDPEWPDPELFAVHPSCERLVLRFHDIIDPSPGMIAPTHAHMEAILAFGRVLPEGEAHLLIHCHAGISRSTAAAAALLLQARPQADEHDLVADIV